MILVIKSLIPDVRYALVIRHPKLFVKDAISMNSAMLLEYDLTSRLIDIPGIFMLARYKRDLTTSLLPISEVRGEGGERVVG